MQVTETKSEGLLREFKITVPVADIQSKTDNRLQDLARTVRLPGFRPGKVPVALLRKRFGDAVRVEALEEIVKDTTGSVLTDRELRATGQPKIEVTASEPDADFEYTMEVELLPEVTAPDYASITLERPTAEPDEKTVEDILGKLAEGHKTAQPLDEPRPAAEGDQVVIDFVGYLDGEEFPGSSAQDYELELGAGMFIPGFEEQLIGAESGEHRQVNVTFPADYGAVELAGKDVVFEVDVKEIKAMAPGVLDDDLAKRFGKETVAELRQEVVDTHRKELRTMTRMVMKRDLLDRLAELYDFEVPKSLLETEYATVVGQMVAEKKEKEAAAEAEAPQDTEADEATKDSVDDDQAPAEAADQDNDDVHAPGVDDSALTEDERSEYRSIAERRVRLGLVLAEVGRSNNLEVSQEELRRAMYAEASKYPGQEKQVLELYEKYPKAAESLTGPILEDKVIDFILEMATVSDREVTIEELRSSLLDPEDETSENTQASTESA